MHNPWFSRSLWVSLLLPDQIWGWQSWKYDSSAFDPVFNRLFWLAKVAQDIEEIPPGYSPRTTSQGESLPSKSITWCHLCWRICAVRDLVYCYPQRLGLGDCMSHENLLSGMSIPGAPVRKHPLPRVASKQFAHVSKHADAACSAQ
jgi:hypothetical protein